MQKRDSQLSLFDLAMLALRFILGVIFIAHGSQKLFGLFGGPGLAKIVQTMGPIGYFVSIGEFFGGLGIVLGFLTRFSAAAQVVIMLGAIEMVHLKNGFFDDKHGLEFPLALLALDLTLLLLGPGQITIGRYLPLPRNSMGNAPHPVVE